jgi:hypothetical protein
MLTKMAAPFFGAVGGPYFFRAVLEGIAVKRVHVRGDQILGRGTRTMSPIPQNTKCLWCHEC